MGKTYQRKIDNEKMARKEAARFWAMSKKSGGLGNVSARSVIHAVVWATDHPRHWRKLNELLATRGMSDAAVLNWLCRDGKDTVDTDSMRRVAELAHELVVFGRVIRDVR